MTRLKTLAAMAAAMGIVAPGFAGQPDNLPECTKAKNRLIVEICSGLSDRALASCKVRYEKAEAACFARASRTVSQQSATDQIRARRAAEAAAAKARRARLQSQAQ